MDFLVPTSAGVLPVEVKSGAAGSLKSLHRYLAEAEQDLGVRLHSGRGGWEHLEVEPGAGQTLSYRLRSAPLSVAELIP